MKERLKPDLNAPRFRKPVDNTLNRDFCTRVKKQYPDLKKFTNKELKDIIRNFNVKLHQLATHNRDGVELLDALGIIFIGSCKIKYKEDRKRPANNSLRTDNKTCKIFYTNFNKYTFKNHQYWGFTGSRDFKRLVSKVYPTKYKQYINMVGVGSASRLFKEQKGFEE